MHWQNGNTRFLQDPDRLKRNFKKFHLRILKEFAIFNFVLLNKNEGRTLFVVFRLF